MPNKIDIRNANQPLTDAIEAGLEHHGNRGLYSQNALNMLESSKTNELIDMNSTNANGANILHAMVAIVAPNTFEKLLEAGLDPNSQDKNGDTPIHKLTAEQAMKHPNDSAKLIEVANKNGVDFSVKNKDGVSALDHISNVKAEINKELALKKATIPAKAEEMKKEFQEKESDILSNFVHDKKDLETITNRLKAQHEVDALKYEPFLNQEVKEAGKKEAIKVMPAEGAPFNGASAGTGASQSQPTTETQR